MDIETKLNKEFDEVKAKHPMVPAESIYQYLVSKGKKDAAFAEYLLMEGKHLDGCFSHVTKEARAIIKGSCGWIDDAVVYQMAVTYYTGHEVENQMPDPNDKEIPTSLVPVTAPKEKEPEVVECKENVTKVIDEETGKYVPTDSALTMLEQPVHKAKPSPPPIKDGVLFGQMSLFT